MDFLIFATFPKRVKSFFKFLTHRQEWQPPLAKVHRFSEYLICALRQTHPLTDFHFDLFKNLSWNQDALRLTFNADPLGIQPVFYLVRKDWIALASRPLCFQTLLHLCSLDPWRLSAFLTRITSPLERDFWKTIRVLLPSQQLIWSLNSGLTLLPRPRIEVASRKQSITSFEQASSTLKKLLKTRLKAIDWKDSAIALSSGLDSNLLAALTLDIHGISSIQAITLGLDHFYSSNETPRLEKIIAFHKGKLQVHTWNAPHSWNDELNLMRLYADLGPWGHPTPLFFIPFIREMALLLNFHKVITGEGGDQLFHKVPLSHLEKTKNTLKAGFKALGLLSQYYQRRLKKVSLKLSWSNPWYWVQTEVRSEMSYAFHPFKPNPWAWIDHSPWLEASRIMKIIQDQTKIALIHPYLTPSIFEWSHLLDKKLLSPSPYLKPLLRFAIHQIMPGTIEDLPKDKSFDDLVEWMLAVDFKPMILDFFQNSKLSQMGLIDDYRFQQVYHQYLSAYAEKQHKNLRGYLNIIALWRTFSAEFWLRNLDVCHSSNDLTFFH